MAQDRSLACLLWWEKQGALHCLLSHCGLAPEVYLETYSCIVARLDPCNLLSYETSQSS